MLQNAQRALRHSPRSFHFREMNAKSIAFEDAGFDAVIANHVLYYMSDWAKALSEAHRVLKPGGRFYASASGRAHLQEVDGLVRRFDAEADFWGLLPAEPFYLENGQGEIANRFSKDDLHRYSDALAITDADLLVDFILSTNARSALVGEKLMAFIQFVEQELSAQETIHVTKDMGLFEAVRDGGEQEGESGGVVFGIGRTG